jgi:putative tryptophan/tyrosine transport system substrate-binding protein
VRRREFVTLLGGMAAAWPLTARAQQDARMRRIGALMHSNEGDPRANAQFSAFVQALRSLGWVDGRTLRVDVRWSEADAGRARTFATELIGLAPDAILSSNTENLTALVRQAPTIPIVFVNVNDPVAQGFVSNLARPTGNITGFASYEFSIVGKWIDLLRQVVPGLAHVSLIFNPDGSSSRTSMLAAAKSAAPSLGVEVTGAPVHDPDGLARAIESESLLPHGGLVFPTDPFLQVHRPLIVALATRHRLPAIFYERYFPEAGGLMSYGKEDNAEFRQAAVYIDRILKGEKPADLPVQAPTKYELAINLKTAKALGLTVPPALLATADEIIE